jgi:hypothetical protein
MSRHRRNAHREGQIWAARSERRGPIVVGSGRRRMRFNLVYAEENGLVKVSIRSESSIISEDRWQQI